MRAMNIKFCIGALVALGLFSSCRASDDRGGYGSDLDSNTADETTPGSDSELGTEGETAASGGGCKGIDFLFVIDDSGSMQEEQSNLVLNFPKVIEVLDGYTTPGGAKLNYRLGVTTTSVTRNFSLKSSLGPTPASPSMPVADGQMIGTDYCGLWKPWVDGPAPDLAEDFSCMANVGTDGWGFEMPFAAIGQALGPQSAVGKLNHGFYRKDQETLLVVVVLTDEDDCSVNNGAKVSLDPIDVDDDGGAVDRCDETKSTGMIPAADVKAFFDELTGGEGRYVFVGIAGPKGCEENQPRMCDSPFGRAYWAKRVEELVGLCGKYGFLGDIGSGDLWSSLEQALEVVMSTCDDFGPV